MKHKATIVSLLSNRSFCAEVPARFKDTLSAIVSRKCSDTQRRRTYKH